MTRWQQWRRWLLACLLLLLLHARCRFRCGGKPGEVASATALLARSDKEVQLPEGSGILRSRCCHGDGASVRRCAQQRTGRARAASGKAPKASSMSARGPQFGQQMHGTTHCPLATARTHGVT